MRFKSDLRATASAIPYKIAKLAVHSFFFNISPTIFSKILLASGSENRWRIEKEIKRGKNCNYYDEQFFLKQLNYMYFPSAIIRIVRKSKSTADANSLCINCHRVMGCVGEVSIGCGVGGPLSPFVFKFCLFSCVF